MLSEKRSVFYWTRLLLVGFLALIVVAGCSNMEDQRKLDEPFQSSQTFGRAAKDILPEAVPVGFERADEHLYYGTIDGVYADVLPFELSTELLERGQKRFNEFCSVCHGLDGAGEGVVALEGFPQPATYHTDALRSAPVGYFFHVITNGKGTMFSYASRIQPEDRWAIVAYIRALQLSQYAVAESLPEEAQAELATLGQ